MISPLANVHPDATIHPTAEIAAFVTIEADVKIEANTWIGPNAVIMSGSRIGSQSKIFPGAVIGAIPQDLKFKGEYTTAEVGNNTTIREYVTINRGTADRGKTAVGNNCLLMAYVHVAHDCIIGNNCIIANSVALAGHITIQDFAVLEGLVAVQQFMTIGQHSFVAGASLVRKNVPPYVKVAREPLSYVGVNSIGLARRGFSDEVIREIENIYRIIFVQNQNLSKALDQVEAQIADSPHRDEILKFIRESEKGIVKGIQ